MTDGLDPDGHDGTMKSRSVTRMPLSRTAVRAIRVPRGERSTMSPGLRCCSVSSIGEVEQPVQRAPVLLLPPCLQILIFNLRCIQILMFTNQHGQGIQNAVELVAITPDAIDHFLLGVAVGNVCIAKDDCRAHEAAPVSDGEDAQRIVPEKGRFREVRGSWRSWVELQSTEVEVDRGLEMLAVAVAAGRYPDGLDAGVQAFGAGVGDRVGEVGQQSRLVALQCLGSVDDRLQPGVGGPEVPAFEVLGAPAAALVGPEVAQVFLDRPGTSGLQVRGA